jgi:hypothetical protein
MPGRLRLLGQTVLKRHAAPVRAGGLRLAQNIAAARTPERIVEASTRLARGRSIGRAAAARPVAAELPRPPGMSEFAARWIFGDGPAEGIPLHGEAALANITTGERPSFLAEQDAREAQIAEAQAAFRSQPVVRGQVQEASPAGFKLARKPVERPAEPPAVSARAVPTTSERVIEEIRPASMPQPAWPEPLAPEPVAEEPGPSTPVPTAAETPPPTAPVALTPLAPEPPVPPVAPEPLTPQAGTAAAPLTAPQAAPARPKLTVSRAEEPVRRQRPALHVLSTPDPAPRPAPIPLAGEPEAEPPAPPAPARGIFRRAVDAVLRREPPPAPPGPAAEPPAQVAATTTPTPQVAPVAPIAPTLPAPRRFPRLIGRRLEESEHPTPPPEPTPPMPAQEPPPPEPTPVAAEAAAPSPQEPPTEQPEVDEPSTGTGATTDSGEAPRTRVPLELRELNPEGDEPEDGKQGSPATPGSSQDGPTPPASDGQSPGGQSPGEQPPGGLPSPRTPPAEPGAAWPARSTDSTAAVATPGTSAAEPPAAAPDPPAVPTPDLPEQDMQAAGVSRVPPSVSRSPLTPGPPTSDPLTPGPPTSDPLTPGPLRAATARLFGRRPPASNTPTPAQPGARPALPATPVPGRPSAARPPGAPHADAIPTIARTALPVPATAMPSVKAATVELDLKDKDEAPPRPTAVYETVPRAPHGRAETAVPSSAARRSLTPARGSVGVERPPLRLVSSPSQPSAARALLARSPEPGEPSPAARSGSTTSGARLAAATGAAFSSEPGGIETVVFPRPAGLQAASDGTLSRADSDARNDNASGNQGSAPSAPSAPSPPPPAGGGGGGIEEIYDQVIERLRRELLADRERMGDVLGDLP